MKNTSPDSPRRLSVILPVYNLDRYLDNTLQNLIQHQFHEWEPGQWEIIIINDGSTDSSWSIAQNYVQRYPESVRLIDAPNLGVSCARNSGLGEAHGKYIYFMDGDDLLLAGALPQLYEIAERTGTDILHFMFRPISPEEYDRLKQQPPQCDLTNAVCQEFDADEFMNKTESMSAPDRQWAIWQNLFRRDFITTNNLRFNEGQPIGEDAVFNIEAMLLSPRFVTVESRPYLYLQRKDGAIQSALKSDCTDRFESILAGRAQYIIQLRDIRAKMIRMDYNQAAIKGVDNELHQIYFDYMLRLLLNATPSQQAMAKGKLTDYTEIHPENYKRVRQFIADGNFDEPTTFMMNSELSPTFYHALSDTIANGASLLLIFSMLRRFKKSGGHIKFGKPRFHSTDRKRGAGLRRWIAAYIFALILKF